MSMRCKGRDFLREAMKESTKYSLCSGGVTELGAMVFSRVSFGLQDLDGGQGGMVATTQLVFLSFSGSTSVSGLWLPPHLVVAWQPSGHDYFDHSLVWQRNQMDY